MDEETRISLKDQFNSLLVRAIEGRRGGQDCALIAFCKLRHLVAQFQGSSCHIERMQHQTTGDIQVMLRAGRKLCACTWLT